MSKQTMPPEPPMSLQDLIASTTARPGRVVIGDDDNLKPAPAHTPEPAPTPPAETLLDLDALRAKFPKREAVQMMSLKVPKSFYDEMSWISRLTGVTMTEMLLTGAAKELAKIKARIQAETKKAGGAP